MFLPHHVRLTPAMRSVLQGLARATCPPIHSLTPGQARAAYERGANVLEPGRPSGCAVTSLLGGGLASTDKLRTSHVAVEEIYRGVTHEFIKMGRAVREARQAHADAARAIARALQAPDP